MTGSISTVALLTGTTALLLVLVTVGLAQAARTAGLSRSLAPWVAAGLCLWLGAATALARSGVLADWTAMPPRWPLLPLTALGTLLLLGWTRTFGRLLVVIPRWRPVALQAFRVGVELAFWRLHAEGAAPVQVTFEGRNFDALVGLTAPVAAAGIALRWVGPRMTITWNLFGLAMLANAIGTVATSTPGPFHLHWPGEPFTSVATWPVIWIPALLAPIGIFLHVVSIRQAIAGDATRGPSRMAPHDRLAPDALAGPLSSWRPRLPQTSPGSDSRPRA